MPDHTSGKRTSQFQVLCSCQILQGPAIGQHAVSQKVQPRLTRLGPEAGLLAIMELGIPRREDLQGHMYIVHKTRTLLNAHTERLLCLSSTVLAAAALCQGTATTRPGASQPFRLARVDALGHNMDRLQRRPEVLQGGPCKPPTHTHTRTGPPRAPGSP